MKPNQYPTKQQVRALIAESLRLHKFLGAETLREFWHSAPLELERKRVLS